MEHVLYIPDQVESEMILGFPPAGTMALLGVAIIVGLFYCFVGYRLFRFVLGLTGFLLAGTVAGGLAALISHGHAIWTAAGVLLGGIAGALALFFLYYVGVFLLGLLAGAIMGYGILAHRPESWVPWAILGAAVLGGLAAWGIERPVMTVATSAIGAWVVVTATVLLLEATGLPLFKEILEEPAHQQNAFYGMVACCAALTLAGTIVQFLTYPPKEP